VRSAGKDRGSVLSGGCLSWLAPGGLGTPFTNIFHCAQTMIRVVFVAIACGLYVELDRPSSHAFTVKRSSHPV
jgi:hypothetical protein